jgi:hypothetical protein
MNVRVVRFATVVILLGLAGAPAFPQAAPSGQPPPQRPPAQPQPFPQNPAATAEHVKLRFLLGAWEEEVDYSGADAGPGRGRWFARPALGLHIVIEYQGGGPQGPYRANGILTWDLNDKVYRLWWFDDQGTIGEYRGQFTDENTLALEHRSKVGGRDFRERLIYQRVSPTEVRTHITQSWEGAEFKPYLDAIAIRTGDRPPPPPQTVQPPAPGAPPPPTPLRPPLR